MMDRNKLEELRELVDFLKANGIAEFDLDQDDLKVRIKFAGEPAAAPAGGFDLAQLSRLMASAPAAGATAAALRERVLLLTSRRSWKRALHDGEVADCGDVL